MSYSLLFVVNDPAFFLSHRLRVALGAKGAGYLVKVATMPGPAVERIRQLGFEHHELPLTRSGSNPLAEIATVLALIRLLWKVKPTVLHLVTIKPVLYGSLASRFAPVKGVVCAVSGLGFVFMKKGFKAFTLRSIVSLLYRLALRRRNLKVIFQNPDDRDVLLKMRAVRAHQVEIIRGSGVDLELYKTGPEPSGIPIVCFAARLLADKGVFEFVSAARILKARGIDARFLVAGDIDKGNPSSISDQDLDQWRREEIVEVLGYQDDIAGLFSSVNLVVLPSYREGLPKVLVEAAAAGRAVVTTDVPGCRDAIDPGLSGLLVPVKSAELLANAIENLVGDRVLRERMGQAGRALAEREFDINKIVDQHLAIYRKVREGQ